MEDLTGKQFGPDRVVGPLGEGNLNGGRVRTLCYDYSTPRNFHCRWAGASEPSGRPVEITSMELVAVLRKTARERAQRTAQARHRRREKAWEVARAAAALLKSHYRAARVVAFGSLTQADRFHLWSDVDLAVWGLAPADYFEAVAKVLDIGNEIKVDLIMAERCKPYLREIVAQGTEL